METFALSLKITYGGADLKDFESSARLKQQCCVKKALHLERGENILDSIRFRVIVTQLSSSIREELDKVVCLIQ